MVHNKCYHRNIHCTCRAASRLLTAAYISGRMLSSERQTESGNKDKDTAALTYPYPNLSAGDL